MALSTKTLDALNDSRKTEPHKYIWGQFTPDKEGTGYSDLPEQTNIPDDAKVVLDVNGPSLVTASVKDLKDNIGGGSIATTEKAGIVKPDGTTISVSSDGTIGTTLDTSNFITNSALSNCILSAPNGVMQANYTPLSEQMLFPTSGLTSDNWLTSGTAVLNPTLTKYSFDKNQSWEVRTTFKVTKNVSTNILRLDNHSGGVLPGWKVGNFYYEYLDIFGLIQGSGDTIKFCFLRGYNTGTSYIEVGSQIDIQLNTEYTATYNSGGYYTLYQGETLLKSSGLGPFSTAYPEAQDKFGAFNWSSYPGPINFNNTNLTYNSGAKIVPIVGDPYTLTVNKGLKVALADGYNLDRTPKSEIITLENDVRATELSTDNYNWPIYVILAKPVSGGDFRLLIPSNTGFSVVDSTPENIPTDWYKVWYNKNTNFYYDHNSGVVSEYKGVLLGYGRFVDSKFTDIVPYKPIQLSLEGLGDYVVSFQATLDGSWYRKYKSGWVEQGGYFKHPDGGGPGTATITLPVEMASSNYQVIRTVDKGGKENDSGSRWVVGINGNTRTTTSFAFFYDQVSYAIGDFWEVKGMSK